MQATLSKEEFKFVSFFRVSITTFATRGNSVEKLSSTYISKSYTQKHTQTHKMNAIDEMKESHSEFK